MAASSGRRRGRVISCSTCRAMSPAPRRRRHPAHRAERPRHLAESDAFFSYRRTTLEGRKDYGRDLSLIALVPAWQIAETYMHDTREDGGYNIENDVPTFYESRYAEG